MKKGIIAIIVAVILAGALILVANIWAGTVLSIKNKGYVSVKGFAKEDIVADLGILKAEVVAENADLQACYTQLAGDMDKVKIYLGKNFKIAAEELELKPVSIIEEYKINARGFNTEEFVKYILRQEIRIESADVNKIADIASGLISILNEGVKINIQNPEYGYTKLEDLKITMIGRATENARERALTIAKEGKFRLGPISDVRVGVFQITPKNSTDISDYGINDTTSIEKEIKSVVEIKYFVK